LSTELSSKSKQKQGTQGGGGKSVRNGRPVLGGGGKKGSFRVKGDKPKFNEVEKGIKVIE